MMIRMIRYLVTAAAVVVIVSGSLVVGLAGEPEPVLTSEQKLQIQVLVQAIEIAQLKAQAAQKDFDVAKDALVRLTDSLKRDGYTLDWQRGVYVRAANPPEQP